MSANKEPSWESVSLGDISTITMGQSPSSSSYNEYGIGNYLIQGNADIKDRKSAPRQWTSEPTKLCDVGDTLMTVRAPVGAMAKSIHNACIGRGVCSIKPNNVDHEYLYQFLLSYEKQWRSLEQGSTFTAVNGTDIKGVKLQIPPLKEQQKIAEILSTVDAKIEIVDQQISETQELKKGLMQQLLTKGIGHTEFKDSALGKIPKSWEVNKIGETCHSFAGGTPKRSVKEYYKNGTIPWVKSGEVDNDNITSTKESVTELAINETSTRLIKSKSILVALYGATAGKVGVLKMDACSNQAVLAINSNVDFISNKFLYHFLKSITKTLLVLCQGSGQPNLSKKIIDNVNIPIPQKGEQQQIATILTTTDDKLEVLSEKKTTYQELKQGLMQQLLTGKVRV
jgi:type I restriction enzyme S subunit